MRLQLNQANQCHQLNRRFAGKMGKSDKDTSLHARRRMIESQEKARASESVRVTLSGEAMSLARQVKAMERLDQYMNTQKEKTEEGKESVELTDEELYEELWAQVKMWGDKTADILHDYNHRETKEMAGERAAALTQMMKLEELQKSEISKMQRDAQRDMVTASMQQEEISRKNSELLMMIESFEKQDEDEEQSEEKENSSEQPEGSLMEGQLGDNHFSMAAHQKKELQSLFDEDDIMRLRGQSSILKRMEEISERLQEKLDERGQIDEDTGKDEKIRDNEEQEALGQEALEQDVPETEESETA